MSGTSYGACILHVAPESYVGGPLAFVQTGDEIEIDVDAAADPSACHRRGTGAPRGAWTPPPPRYARGYGAMFSEHIGQADEGCDFDFLQARGADAGAGDSLRPRMRPDPPSSAKPTGLREPEYL